MGSGGMERFENTFLFSSLVASNKRWKEERDGLVRRGRRGDAPLSDQRRQGRKGKSDGVG